MCAPVVGYLDGGEFRYDSGTIIKKYIIGSE